MVNQKNQLFLIKVVCFCKSMIKKYKFLHNYNKKYVGLFVFGRFVEPKHGVLTGLDELNRANNDEISENGFCFSAIDMCQFLEFL